MVGVGRLGAEHARLLARSPHFELVGVHDLDAARAARTAGATGARACGSLAELIEICEALVVAVPTSAHFATAHAALDARRHVLVEKPIAATLEEADALIEIAGAREVILGVGHVERFNGVLAACRPYLNRPRYIESLRLAPFQPRGSDVTVVLDLMIHDIDLVLGLTSSPLADVHAVGVPVITDSIDIANARLVFADGTVATITASRVSTRALRQLRLFQTSGYFSLDLAAGRGEHLRRTRPVDRDARAIEDMVDRIEIVGTGGEPLARELEAFARRIRGRPSELVTGGEGRAALAVAARITREIEEFAHVLAQDP